MIISCLMMFIQCCTIFVFYMVRVTKCDMCGGCCKRAQGQNEADLVSVDCRRMARCLPVTITYTPTAIGAEPFCEHVLHKLITYIAYNMHCCQ